MRNEIIFHVVLFIKLYNVALVFESENEILKCDHSNESYWAALPCGTVYIMLYKVVLTFECVDEILKCNDKAKEVLLNLCMKSLSVTKWKWNESYGTVLSRGAVCYALQCDSN